MPVNNNNIDNAMDNLSSRFNDMFAASPSSLKKISSSSKKEYPSRDDGARCAEGGNRRDVSRFAAMFSASPAELKKSKELASSPLPSIARVIYDDINACDDENNAGLAG